MKAKIRYISLPIEALHDPRLSHAERILLAYWSQFDFEHGSRCRESNQAMASALGMSEKTIANSLTNMRALGILRGRCFPLAHEVAYQDGKAERKPFPAWIRNTGLSSGPATLYICLMTHADADTGLAYVTVKELMKDTGMGKATIHRHLRSLEAARYLYRKSGQSEGERNEYLLWKPNATFPDGSLMPVPKHFRGVPHE